MLNLSEIAFTGASIDTRTLQKGNLFFALRALRDGHDFVPEAVAKGAAAVIVDHRLPELGIPQIVVDDTYVALADMAHHWRQRFSIPIIALTGSCGKTSTKEMLVSILSQHHQVLASPGNFNNALGVPLTLLHLTPQHEYAVIEMGTNSPGEIAYVAEITEPTVSLITNIGASHLEKLGSLEGVSEEKSDIFTSLPSTGIAIIHQDEPFHPTWAAKIGGRKQIRYGLKPTADVFATDHIALPHGMEFTLHTPAGEARIALAVPGHHVAVNALAAAATAFALGFAPTEIATGLKAFHSVTGRFRPHMLKNGCLLIDDTQNASVTAVKNAIDSLAARPGKKIFVMSHLGELGDHSAHYHDNMGQWCAAAHFDQVFFWGRKADLAPALAQCKEARYFSEKSELIAALLPLLTHDTTVLIKGVHSAHMNDIVNAILNEDPPCQK